MNRPWEDLLRPDTMSSRGDNLSSSGMFQTALGGLSGGFRSDFWLRGYKMIGQMTGQVSFVQGLFLALTGRLATSQEDRLLNSMFINNGLTDPRFWLFRTARLAATVKSPPTSCLAAGLLVNDGAFLGSGAAYHTSLFFHEAKMAVEEQQADLQDLVRLRLAGGRIIGGFGRVLARGPDERNEVLLQVARECALADGPYLAQAFAIEQILQESKNRELYMNSAGLCCSLLLDLGMLPHQIMIFCAQLFLIGMSGNIAEAYERPAGEFPTLSGKDIAYIGPARKTLPNRNTQHYTVAARIKGVRVVVMDSISFLEREHDGDIVVCGSHGGLPAAEYALRFPPGAVIFSDAGRGKDEAGIQGLGLLQEKGIAALAVSVDSARIGDGLDIYHNGVVSAANDIAREAGAAEGMTVQQAARELAVPKTISQNS